MDSSDQFDTAIWRNHDLVKKAQEVAAKSRRIRGDCTGFSRDARVRNVDLREHAAVALSHAEEVLLETQDIQARALKALIQAKQGSMPSSPDDMSAPTVPPSAFWKRALCR